ncbi:hypothetical protein FQR65_LT20827 [Abscondita terminalis]|nr:hypothetical protein FQR65_LT20827 [Abscondita terminalis]
MNRRAYVGTLEAECAIALLMAGAGWPVPGVLPHYNRPIYAAVEWSVSAAIDSLLRLHVTATAGYSGWISGFMGVFLEKLTRRHPNTIVRTPRAISGGFYQTSAHDASFPRPGCLLGSGPDSLAADRDSLPQRHFRLALPRPCAAFSITGRRPGRARTNCRRACGCALPFGAARLIGILLEGRTQRRTSATNSSGAGPANDSTPPLPPALLKLAYGPPSIYQHSLGDTLSWALPALLRQGEPGEARQERFWSIAPGARLDDPRLARAPRQRAALATLAQHPHGVAHPLLSQLQLHKDSLELLLAKGRFRSSSPPCAPRARPWPLAWRSQELPHQQRHSARP